MEFELRTHPPLANPNSHKIASCPLPNKEEVPWPLSNKEPAGATAEGSSRSTPLALHRLAVRYEIPRELAFSFSV